MHACTGVTKQEAAGAVTVNQHVDQLFASVGGIWLTCLFDELFLPVQQLLQQLAVGRCQYSIFQQLVDRICYLTIITTFVAEGF